MIKSKQRRALVNAITCAEFDHKLAEIMDKMSGEEILTIPGVYMVLASELQGQVVDAIVDGDCGKNSAEGGSNGEAKNQT